MGFNQAWLFRDCPWCGLRETTMGHAARIAAAPYGGGLTREYSLLTCPRCAGFIVLEHTPDPDTTLLRVWPQGELALDVHDLPPDVERYYREAKLVLDAGVPDAAAVQLRKTLEAAARHRGIQRRTLVELINGLIDDGAITKEFGRVLNEIRRVGNVGAHAGGESVDRATVERVFRFTTAVLRNLFEIPAELERLAAETSASTIVTDVPEDG